MKKQIVINASKDRSRIAIVEDGELVELYVENPDNVRTIGNIYLGKVKKVMPPLRAAFVDIGHATPAGEKQDAFLHFSDLTENFPQLQKMAGEDVPGLDDVPVLAHAPQKRIADDASEPDVEERLEVTAPEDEEPSRARSTRSRRRGGRRRSGSAGHEEDEQEEAADGLAPSGGERPRRAVAVIDLTSRPKPPAPKPARPPARASEAPEAPALAPPPEEARQVEADPGPGADDTSDRRPRRRTRGKAQEPSGSTAPASAPPDPPPAAEQAAPSPEAPVAGAPPADASARPPRQTRRRTRADQAADVTPARNTSPVAQAAPAAGGAAPPASREPASSPEPPADSGRPPRRTRGARGAGADTPGDGSADAPAQTTPPAPPPDVAPKATRGAMTIDLTAPARPAATAPRPEASAADDTAPDVSDDDARPRRRSRRSSSAPTPEAAALEAPDPGEAEATPSPREPADRSRRRSRSDGDPRPDEPQADVSPARADTDRPRRATEGRASNGRAAEGSRPPGRKPAALPPNEQLLRTGGHVIVKVTKEPISSKGSRVSTDISLAGRFLVLVPAADYVAVSKKIESAKERRRLRTLAEGLKPANCGVIVRTVAEGQDARSLDADLRLLIRKWNDIEARLDGGRAKAPLLLYEDLNMVSSIIRDLFSDNFERILVDDPDLHRRVQAYVKAVAPDMAERVVLHRAATPVFRAVGIETQVEQAFSKRVPLKSGGYLFIETTEAMHVVDVNSGRAGRGKSQKENMIAVNVEAAREIAKQLRLRDLGGIVVVDFIDLKMDADRRKVTNALKDAFEKDRAVTKLLPMSDFGVVQITRQRLRPSITTHDDDDGDARDPAALAARAGAGEIEQAPRHGLDLPDGEHESRRAEAPPRATDAPRRRREPSPPPRDADVRREPSPPRDEAPASTPEALAVRLRAWLGHYRASVDERYRDRPVVVRVHPLFAAHLRRGLFSLMLRWRFALGGLNWSLAEDASMDALDFDVVDDKSGRSLKRKYAPAE